MAQSGVLRNMTSTLKFSNNLAIPVIGLGTYESPREQVHAAVVSALEAGYRHIDCAYLYSNEEEIGNALSTTMKKLNLRREDVFITSKCWCTHLHPDRVRICCERSLKALKLQYLDLYLAHWPVAFKPAEELFPMMPDGKHFDVDKVCIVDTWKAMEKLVDDGLVKSIGISNYNRRQIDTIMKHCRIKPVNLQVEIHANFPNTKLVEYAQSLGLTVTAYAPLGSPGALPGATNLLTEQWVTDIAKRHNKTPAQVLIRYLLQRKLVVIPKSVTQKRIVENSDVFDFNLSEEEMNNLGSKGQNKRRFLIPQMEFSDEYPFKEEY